MNNAELIAALRYHADCTIYNCDGCPYQIIHKTNGMCIDRMIIDAADALEADEARIAEMSAQIPKEGEWIWENYCWHCSVCGENPTKGMGYVQGKNELFRVCPNCGARMTEVQDG